MDIKEKAKIKIIKNKSGRGTHRLLFHSEIIIEKYRSIEHTII